MLMRLFIATLFFIIVHNAIYAVEPTWIEDKQTGCKVQITNPSPSISVTWSGECVDGKAHGNGILIFYKDDIEEFRHNITTKNGLTMVNGVLTANVDPSTFAFTRTKDNESYIRSWIVKGVVNKEIALSYKSVADYIMEKAAQFAYENCSIKQRFCNVTVLLYQSGEDDYAVRGELLLSRNRSELKWGKCENRIRDKRLSEAKAKYRAALAEKKRLEEEKKRLEKEAKERREREAKAERERRESESRRAREEQKWAKSGKSLGEFPKERILSAVMFELENKLLHCGDAWYGWGGGSGDFRGTILELKDISVEVKPYELSKADRANGIEWKGLVFIKCDLYREHVGKEWGKWKDGSGGVRIFQIGFLQMTEEPGVVSLVIENGEWHWSSYFSNAEKPNYTCKNIPK